MSLALALAFLALSLSPVFPVVTTVGARMDQDGTTVNGNQELITDPSRTVAYYGDGGNVVVWNYNTDATTTIPSGGNIIRSLDLSPDGTTLVAAVDASVAIIDVTSIPSLARTYGALWGNTISVRFITNDVVVLSYETGDFIATMNLSTGTVSSTFDVGISPVLEVDDGGTSLLAFSLGRATDTVVKKYSISGASFSLVAESGPRGGTLVQAAVDWSRGRAYLACHDRPAIQVLALGDLSEIGSFPTDNYPSSLALSVDGRVIYEVAAGGEYPTGRSVVFSYQAESGTLLSRNYLDVMAGPIAATEAYWEVVTAAPLHLQEVGPSVEPQAPLDGQALSYSPSYVQFIASNFPAITADRIALTVDGNGYDVRSVASDTFRADLPGLLAGAHEAVVTVDYAGVTIRSNWTFFSGSVVSDALQPSVHLLSPEAGSNSNETPSAIVLGVDMPSPPPASYEVRVVLNNIVLPAVAGDEPYHYIAKVPLGLDLTGINTVTGEVVVEGVPYNETWSFGVFPPPTSGEYDRVWYGQDFSVLSPVDWTVGQDIGGSELVLTGPTWNGVATTVTVDVTHEGGMDADYAYIDAFANGVIDDLVASGHPALLVGPVNHTVISNLTAGVWKVQLTDDGVQEAYALIVDGNEGERWLFRGTTSDTEFIFLWPTLDSMISSIEINGADDPPATGPMPVQGYAYYRDGDDYQLMVPDNWSVSREGPQGTENVSMWAVGPGAGGYAATILLQEGVNASLPKDHEGLTALVVDVLMPQLASQGIDAILEGDPEATTISGQPAVVFSYSVSGTGSPIMVHREYLIAEENGDRYWWITCSSPQAGLPTNGPLFDTAAQSFTVLSPSPTGQGSTSGAQNRDWWTFALLGTGAALAVVLLYGGLRWRRK